ncbi:MAG: hypothetical protein JWP81_2426 [Ferruginibacter sp.]|nr:hypothetical protein [Ferruginibacter sp.]
MAISLNQYETQLLSEIMVAGSQEEVKSLIDTFLEKRGKNKVGIEQTSAFLDTAISYLESLNPMNKDANQWSNINMARIHFQHIKRELESVN